ncbi:SusD/RagB family nutrient-binding outer membrane lipoprotein [Lewinella sp. JB7]|uniref:SusD/RagB family nutrient-binding outer membrane lipoprotein n=1 Tax=Lewinella sp. JB7 TaxID=2962887 RepID=UPI0020C982AE|nr:SusD/RagB family nutrient-binding outer membrane lipoprotein [Lewinella sp. JB7]MCP9236056.1 SusD/RagB family nutrient-binding outer membrane lipoprotein [Lewinella sp. JB7]
MRFLGLATVVSLGLASCQSFVEDINIDPNNFTDISNSLITNHAVLNLATISEAETARIAGMWTDQFTGSDRQYITQDNYGVGDSDFDAIWGDIYRGGLTQAQIAADKARELGSESLLGVAEILQGHYAAEAALLFGDVPFTQANKAAEFADPVYEPQRDVLMAAIALIEGGIAKTDLKVTDANSVLSSSSTWDQFGNALIARYKLAMRDYAGALAAAQAANFSSASNSVDIIHSTTNFAENSYYQFEAEQRTDYLTFDNSYLINLIAPDSTDTYRGDDKTDDSNRVAYYADNSSDFIRLNTNPNGLFAAAQNWPVIGYPEVQLIIAESAARTGDTDTAIEALNNARNYWDGVMGTDDYQDYDEDDFGDDDSLLKTILTEKFVSVFGVPTFYDIVRTNNLIGTDLDGRTTPAQRFLYPSTERSSNANYPGLKELDTPTPING